MDWTHLDEADINMAHKEARKAADHMMDKNPNYTAALECHQKAHALLRKTLFDISLQPSPAIPYGYKSIMDSIQSQMDFHTREQCVILNILKREVIELKRQPYMASLQERHTADIIQLIFEEHSKITQKLSENDTLLETLEDIKGDSHVGKKKPKCSRETLEELHNTNKELKKMLAGLLDANIDLMKENEALRDEKTRSGGNFKMPQSSAYIPPYGTPSVPLPLLPLLDLPSKLD